MSPFPGTRVVHPRWAEHHRPTAVGTLTATCRITTGGTGDWTPATGPTGGTPTTVYEGPCSLTDTARSTRPADAAGQSVAEHPYVVGIDITVAPDIPTGARVTIVTNPQDPHTVNKVLTVAASSYDSLVLERVLLCDLDPANQP